MLFSGLLPGERLTGRHVLGGSGRGFAGVVLSRLAKGGIGHGTGIPWLGYWPGLACAFIWAGYSVLSRRFAEVPTESRGRQLPDHRPVAGLAHLALETSGLPQGMGTGWPSSRWLGPVGAAFFLWDIGMKRGDIRFLGTASYAAPVISTIALVAAGQAQGRRPLAAAILPADRRRCGDRAVEVTVSAAGANRRGIDRLVAERAIERLGDLVVAGDLQEHPLRPDRRPRR